MQNIKSDEQSGYLCPACGVPLVRSQNAVGLFWLCPSCDGRIVSLALLRKTVLREAINEIWQQAKEAGVENKRCVECGQSMRQAQVNIPELSLNVDVCKLCTLIWFDPTEYEMLPQSPAETTVVEELPPAAREALAMAKVEQIRQQYNETDVKYDCLDDEDCPVSGWQRAVGLMGLPVEVDAPECSTMPWVTWLLGAMVLATSAAGLHYGSEFVLKYALIPAEAGRYFGLTWISSFFLHNNVWLLLGNLYFILAFGDNIEDALGKWRYLLLMLLASLAGSAAHIVSNIDSQTPYMGASGGISGVLACYALLFPDTRLSLFIRQLRIFRWITLPAWVLFLAWVCWQIFVVWQQNEKIAEASAYAQLGGAAIGGLFWFILHRLNKE